MFWNNEEMKTIGCRVGFSRPEVGGLKSALQRQDSHSLAALLLGCVALLAAPQVALADNECGLTDGLPGTADTATCDPADYDSGFPNGITYSSDGNFALVIPDGDDTLNVFDSGIKVTGNGTDSIFLDASAHTSTSSSFFTAIEATDGILIDFASQDGDIGIDTSGDRIRANGTASQAIRAVSSGSGDVDILTEQVSSNFNSPDLTGIEAVTDGGNISITSTTISLGGGLNQVANGIIAQTSGGGTITIDVDSVRGGARGIDSASTTVYAETGTGDITFSGELDIAFGNRDDNVGIHAITEGAITLNVDGIRVSGSSSQTANGKTGIVTENSAFATINLLGDVDSQIETVIRSSGGAVLVNVVGDLGDELEGRQGLSGGFDFSGLTDGAEINFVDNAAWYIGAAGLFSPGDDVVNVEEGGLMGTPVLSSGASSPTVAQDSHTIDFGAGNDIIVNDAPLHVGTRETSSIALVRREQEANYEGELRFENLEEFQNSETIYLGGTIVSDVFQGTDLWQDDILAMPGAAFTGTGDSRVVLDAFLNGAGQTACDSGLRSANGDMPVADCIDLSGGSATGTTLVTIRDKIPGDRGAYSPDGEVIVDVSGGSAEPDAFVLAPDSDNYNPNQGGHIDKGLFAYALAYNPDDQQFKLFGVPAPGAQQFALIGHAANDLWRSSADAWLDRQVDQRSTDAGDGMGGSVWFSGKSASADRDVITPIVAGGETLEFDNSYQQDNKTFTFGMDMASRSSGGRSWVLGAMIGYARGEVDFNDSRNTIDLEGVHAGLYGHYSVNDFFVDAVINGSWLTMDNDVPSLDLTPEGTVLNSDVDSFGGQIEAGWSGLSFGRLGVEPLVGLSYVTTSGDDTNVPAGDPDRLGGNVMFDDAKSFRGSLGARLSLANVLPGLAPTDISLTARAIEEFEGDSTASIENVGPIDAPVSDTFDGTFAQVTGSVSITNAAKTVAGFLKVDGTFESDYDSLGVSAGFRYQW